MSTKSWNSSIPSGKTRQCKIFYDLWQRAVCCQSYILFVTSNHQTTNPVFPNIFSTKVSQLEELKKKTNFLLVQNSFFLSFVPMKSLFSFSSGQTEKKFTEKIGENKSRGEYGKKNLKLEVPNLVGALISALVNLWVI